MKDLIINADNYESFALDYLEGELNEEALFAFEHFLEANPDVAAELRGVSLIYVEPAMDISYPHKEALIKTRSLMPMRIKWGAVAAAVLALLLFKGFLKKQGDQGASLVESIQMESNPELVEKLSPPVVGQKEIPLPKETSQELAGIAPIGQQTSNDLPLQEPANEEVHTIDVVITRSTSLDIEEEVAERSMVVDLNKQEVQEKNDARPSTVVVTLLETAPIQLKNSHEYKEKFVTMSLNPIDAKKALNIEGFVPENWGKQEIAIRSERRLIPKALIPESLQ